MKTDLFERHKLSTLFLILHSLIYAWLIYWFASGSSAYPNSCGAANGGLVLLALLATAVCSITLLAFVLFKKGQARKDYKKFLLLIVLQPLIIILIFICSLNRVN